ncbi:NAD(P)H-hydrate dehydratase [Salinibacillus xinjiangensis]|uniref:Bifunctional NAD(P)H-hydrate repair enzyme n=1 Tax=Salinibacillus xinjiangensis TaxID=1229268 RepID=A0A6G1X4X1_9BACI|nr:NAD(P)H-hydrate dehydratase [Salinibacillus xinjiangensis]MRG85878.1 NAD(P)H-hydrate dehydratase [Salinibacillus xinjiangensis]
MLIAGQKDIQQMDQYTINELGMPGTVLMESAGSRVVEEILPLLITYEEKVVVLAGSGNNGGDGFVIARRLIDAGVDVLLCLLVSPEKLKGDAKVHFDVYINRELPIFYLDEHNLEALFQKIHHADIIIDAMLGTGVKGTVRKPMSQVIYKVNSLNKMVVSVDIPSGVNSDDGKVEGEAIKATQTITFVFPKKGFFLQDGPKHIGEWKAVDISVPPSIVSKLNLTLPTLITPELAKKVLPIRPQTGHKGTFGHVLVLGGSQSFVGAPLFTAQAALSSGAGLATLAVPENIYPYLASQSPETLFFPLPQLDGHISAKAIDELRPKLNQYDCIAIGPGMSRFADGETFLVSLLNALQKQTLVIDADALFMLRSHLDILKDYEGDIILTPHPGEMANLTNRTVKDIESNRIEIAQEFAEKYQVFLLLKGHRSIIATPNGEVLINPYGHDALGKGGSGDVLTGVVSSLIAQGAKPHGALITASYLHAVAGEEQAKVLSHYGVMPQDLVDGIKGELNRIIR